MLGNDVRLAWMIKSFNVNRVYTAPNILFILFFTYFMCISEARQLAPIAEGNRQLGEMLPYNPLDARSQLEAELEEDLRREFVRGSLTDREDMTYRFPPKKTYSK
jgi:hypothetical protein